MGKRILDSCSRSLSSHASISQIIKSGIKVGKANKKSSLKRFIFLLLNVAIIGMFLIEPVVFFGSLYFPGIFYGETSTSRSYSMHNNVTLPLSYFKTTQINLLEMDSVYDPFQWKKFAKKSIMFACGVSRVPSSNCFFIRNASQTNSAMNLSSNTIVMGKATNIINDDELNRAFLSVLDVPYSHVAKMAEIRDQLQDNTSGNVTIWKLRCHKNQPCLKIGAVRSSRGLLFLSENVASEHRFTGVLVNSPKSKFPVAYEQWITSGWSWGVKIGRACDLSDIYAMKMNAKVNSTMYNVKYQETCRLYTMFGAMSTFFTVLFLCYVVGTNFIILHFTMKVLLSNMVSKRAPPFLLTMGALRTNRTHCSFICVLCLLMRSDIVLLFEFKSAFLNDATSLYYIVIMLGTVLKTILNKFMYLVKNVVLKRELSRFSLELETTFIPFLTASFYYLFTGHNGMRVFMLENLMHKNSHYINEFEVVLSNEKGILTWNEASIITAVYGYPILMFIGILVMVNVSIRKSINLVYAKYRLYGGRNLRSMFFLNQTRTNTTLFDESFRALHLNFWRNNVVISSSFHIRQEVLDEACYIDILTPSALFSCGIAVVVEEIQVLDLSFRAILNCLTFSQIRLSYIGVMTKKVVEEFAFFEIETLEEFKIAPRVYGLFDGNQLRCHDLAVKQSNNKILLIEPDCIKKIPTLRSAKSPLSRFSFG